MRKARLRLLSAADSATVGTGHYRKEVPEGGSGILAFILVLLLQGWYVVKIPSKLKHDSKKKEESRKTVRKKEKIGERSKLEKN